MDDRIGQRFAQRGLEIEFASIGNLELYDEAYDKFSDRRASSPYPNNTILFQFWPCSIQFTLWTVADVSDFA
jgi:hypothetical protein